MAPRTMTTPDILGILPLQDAVLFPNTVIPLAVVKRPGIMLVEEALREGKQIGLVALKDKDTEDPGPDDLRMVGTIGTIQKMLKVPDGTLRCIVAGGPVFRIDEVVSTEPYLAATFHELPEVTSESDKVVAMQRNLATLFQKLLGYLPQAPREMEMEINNISDPNLLSYFVASTMRLETSDRQAILEERDTEKRLRKLIMLISKELEVVELGHKIQTDIQREMEKNQREFYLRQQLRAIQEELGELVQAHLRLTGRGRTKGASPAELEAARADEAADLICMALLYCRHFGIDPDAAIQRKWLSWLDKAA
jgi:ATP-dependent Lon protease